MAEPLTPEELAELRVDLAATLDGATDPTFVAAFEKVARLLATLDAQRDRYLGVLYDLHKQGTFTLDRVKFGRWHAEHRYTDEGRFAYAALASMTAAEVAAHYADHPEAKERDLATARRLTAEHYQTQGDEQ